MARCRNMKIHLSKPVACMVLYSFLMVCPLNAASNIGVYENNGDLVVSEGEIQQKLLIPSIMKTKSRFQIRIKKSDTTQLSNLGEPSLDAKVEARRIMFKANQAFFSGDLEKTWELIDQAEKLDPGYYRIRNMKGSLLYKLGSRDVARELWKTSLEINPEQPDIKALLDNTKETTK